MAWTNDSDKRLYVNADRDKVVDEGSPDAAYMLVGPGATLDDDEAARLGLMGAKAKRELLAEEEEAAKAQSAPPANKAVSGPRNEK